jgi:thiamine monophosphate synthase
MNSCKDNFNIYYFGNKVSDIIIKKLLKFKKRNIIYINHKNIIDLLELNKLCKKNNIKLYVSNNIHLAKKLNINGIHIPADYRKKIYVNQKKFELIGTVHTQKDFYFKQQQGCSAAFLSPIFNTRKYSENSVLNIQKFNLLSKNWNCQIYALAGINVKNLNKLNMTRVVGFGGISFFSE